MTHEPQVPEPMSFEVSSLHYPNITEPDGTNGKYGVAIPWQSLPERLAEIMGEQVMKAKASSWGLVNLRTTRKPRIHGLSPDQSDLLKLRQTLWAMNLRFESALINRPATLHIVFWEKTQSRTRGLGVSLNSIVIDPSQITLPLPFDDTPFQQS